MNCVPDINIGVMCAIGKSVLSEMVAGSFKKPDSGSPQPGTPIGGAVKGKRRCGSSLRVHPSP